MSNSKKKIIILSLIAFDIMAVIFALFMIGKNNKSQTVMTAMSVEEIQTMKAEISTDAVQTPEALQVTEEANSPFEGKVKLSDYYKITIADDARIVDLPEVINIYDTTPIDIDEETGAMFISNLEDAGWHGHEFESTDIEGLYFIGTKENSDIITSTEKYVESVREFMKVSGLLDYFDELQIELTEEIQGEGRDCTVFYWLTEGGQKTGGYVRINVESGNNCTECKMYLIKSSVYKTLLSVSLKEAVDNAYGKFDDDFEGLEFTLVSAKLRYIEGIPYYDISLTGKEVLTCLMLNAPAISFNELMADEELIERYKDVLG